MNDDDTRETARRNRLLALVLLLVGLVLWLVFNQMSNDGSQSAPASGSAGLVRLV